ncbi:MAG: hypothetical protein M3Z32_08635, partial [Acidobacteriota bacterium]|nr:hypothetical protein [Acidobacteriota bacterium]
ITNEDIGAVPDSNLSYPFVFKEGIAEQSYIVQIVGEAEKAKVLATKRHFSMISAAIAISFAFRI